MHIPDGYISPQTAGGLWALMVPAWYTAGYKVKRALDARQAPLIAIGAAFSFVIMMFNIPLPGGTSGHAVGGTLIAIVLGPWAAMISLTVALAIQAIFFGDGGILAIGANCFIMAFALPLSGYYVYRLLAIGSAPGSRRRWLAAGVGAYAGVNVAAFVTAVILGLQGDLFQAADGSALYSPYGITQTIPAMMIAHLSVVGLIEGGVTALAMAYLQRTDPGLLESRAGQAAARGSFRLKPLIVGLLLLLVFTPLGLLATGTAWGEWSPDELQERLGFVPEGMERMAGFWSGILPDYALPGQEGEGFWASVPGYLLSGLLGLLLVGGLAWLVIALLSRSPADAGRRVTAGTGREGALPVAGGRKRRVSVIQKTLQGMARALRDSVFSEQVAARPGLLQKADPRAKTVALLGLLVLAAFLRNWSLLFTLYALAIVLAWVSRISLWFFVKRVWLFIPLFAGIIVLPSLFNIFRPGDALWTIWDFGHQVTVGPWSLGGSLAITVQGLEGAVLLIMRVAVSVSMAVLLTLTTPWADLLKALRVFYIPRSFIFILSMTYRYIFLLLSIASDMFTARASRMVGPSTPADDRRFAAGSMGTLLGKSHTMSDEIYAAMVSRGYNGEPMSMHRFRMRAADWLGLTVTVMIAAAAIGGDRLIG